MAHQIRQDAHVIARGREDRRMLLARAIASHHVRTVIGEWLRLGLPITPEMSSSIAEIAIDQYLQAIGRAQ